jgi:predicted nucleic acid-binding protein
MIWGVRGISARGDERMIARTQRSIEFLNDSKFTIMIPAPVVAEYLVGADETEMHELEILKRGFEFPEFNVRAAALAAELQRGGLLDSIHDEFGMSKQSIKVDAFIIGIAVIFDAEKIITHDIREFTKLARGRIAIEEVPDLERQEVLFPDIPAGPRA